MILRRDVVKVFHCGMCANLHRTARAGVLAVAWRERERERNARQRRRWCV